MYKFEKQKPQIKPIIPKITEIITLSEKINSYYQEYFINIHSSYFIAKEDAKKIYYIFLYLFKSKKINDLFFISKYSNAKINVISYNIQKITNLKNIRNLISKFLNYCLFNSKNLCLFLKIDNVKLVNIILNILRIFFFKDIFTDDELQQILSLQIILMLYNNKENNLSNNIQSIKQLELIINYLLSFQKIALNEKKILEFNNIIKFLIDLLNKIILQNPNNIYLLSKNSLFFNLIELSQISYDLNKIIIPLLISVYKFHFNIDYIFDSLSKLFLLNKNYEKIENKTFSLISKNLFLAELFKQERAALKDEEIFIPNGFYFNDFPENGIISNPLKKFPNNLNGYSIVVSFKYTKNNSNNSICIFNIYEKNGKKKNIILNVYIHENQLKIKTYNNKHEKKLFNILPNNNYVLWIFAVREKKKYRLIFYLNFDKIILKDIKNPDCLYSIEIGFNSISTSRDNFVGLIGTFILFNKCLIKDENDNQNIMKFIGFNAYYENLIYINSKREHSFIEQNSELILGKINSFDIYEDIEIMISSKSIYDDNILNKNKFICNYFSDNQDNIYSFININSVFTCLNYPIEFNNSFIDFINNYGIAYLQMELYYFISIIDIEKSNLNFLKNINMHITSICSLFFNCLTSMNTMQEKFFMKEIDNFFYTLNDLIAINANYGYKINNIFLSLFGNYFEFLISKNKFFSHCGFLLTYEYYDLNDNKVFELLFNFISMFITQFKESTSIKQLFEKMLELDKIYLNNTFKKNTIKEYSILLRKLIREMIIFNQNDFYLIYRNKIKDIKIKIIKYFDEIDGNKKCDININEYLKLMYKYLKNLYIIFDSKETIEYFNSLFKQRQQIFLEFFNELFQIMNENYDIKLYKNISEFPTELQQQYILSELIKSLCILFLEQIFYDDYLKELEEMSNLKPNKRSGSIIQKNKLSSKSSRSSFNSGSINYTYDKKMTMIIPNINNYSFKRNDSGSIKNRRNSSFDNNNSIMSNIDFILDKNMNFFSKIILTPYIFKSFFLFLFKEISNYKKLQFLKNEKFSDIMVMTEKNFPKTRHFLKIIIDLMEKQKNEIDDTIFMKREELFIFCYSKIHLFCKNMIIYYMNNKKSHNKKERNKDIKLMINVLFSRKEYVNKFYEIAFDYSNIINNENDNKIENSKKNFENFLTELENHFNEFTNNFIYELTDPFYFKFLFEIYTKYNTFDEYVLKCIDNIMDLIMKYKKENKSERNKESKIVEFNNKNLLILIYKIIFYVTKREQIINNDSFLKKLFAYLYKLISDSKIIYLKILFPIEDIDSELIKNSNPNKKLLIEILYEILLELHFEFLRCPNILSLQIIEIIFNDAFDLSKISNELILKQNNKNDSGKVSTLFCLLDKITLETNIRLTKENLVQINKNNYLKIKEIKELEEYINKKYNKEIKTEDNILSVCILFIIKILLSIDELNEKINNKKEIKNNDNINKNIENIENNNDSNPISNKDSINDITPIDTKLDYSFKQKLLTLLTNLFQDTIVINKTYNSLNPFISKNKKYRNQLYENFRSFVTNELILAQNYSEIIPNLIPRLKKYKQYIKIFSRVIYTKEGRASQYTEKKFNQILKEIKSSEKEKEKTTKENESFSSNNENNVFSKRNSENNLSFGNNNNESLCESTVFNNENDNIINNNKFKASLSGNVFKVNKFEIFDENSDFASRSEQNIINIGFSINENSSKKQIENRGKNDVNKRYKPSFKFKKDIMRIFFSYYFKDLLTYDSDFSKIKKIYKYVFKKELKNNINLFKDCNYSNNYELCYPTKFKSYLCNNYNKIFLKKDFEFFTDNTFELSHKFLTLINYKTENIILFPNKKLIEENDYAHKNIQLNEDISNINVYDCELLTINGSIFGNLYEFEDCILFKSDLINDKRKPTNESNLNIDYAYCSLEYDFIKKNKKIIIEYNNIKEVINRTFFFSWISLEIFTKNGKNFLFNFFNEDTNNAIFEIFKTKKINVIKNTQDYFNKEDFAKKWKNNIINTFDYLLILNKLTSRTYNDSNQYLIMPWLFLMNKNIRNFDIPISVQDNDKREEFLKQFKQSFINEIKDNFAQSNHYSTSAYIYFYLMRTNPFTKGMLKFQSNNFDVPERQFFDFKQTLFLCQRHKNNRELIPELFSMPEVYLNLNFNDFGKQKEGLLINDVNCKPYAENPVEFCYFIRNMLNFDANVNNNINKWFDFIFGINQISKNKNEEKFLRSFNSHSYSQFINSKKMYNELRKKKNQNNNDLFNEIKTNVNISISFGQCPYQILTHLHPQKNLIIRNNSVNIVNCDCDEIQEISKNREKNGNNEIIYFSKSNNDNYLYCLLNDKNLEIYKKNTTKDDEYYSNIILKHKCQFLFLEKTKIYKQNYIFCELKDDSFIFCQTMDKTLRHIKINYNQNYQIENSILLKSYVTCILRINDTEFITGHNNGKLCKWLLIDSNIPKIELLSNIKSNNSNITCILNNEKLGILISCNKNNIIIRKNYDFEFLNYIKIEGENTCIVDIKISCFDYLYALVNINNSDDFELQGYTLNGLYFGKYKGKISNFEFTKSGKIIIGEVDNGRIKILDPINFKQLYCKIISNNENDRYFHFHFEKPDIIYFGSNNEKQSKIKIIQLNDDEKNQIFV